MFQGIETWSLPQVDCVNAVGAAGVVIASAYRARLHLASRSAAKLTVPASVIQETKKRPYLPSSYLAQASHRMPIDAPTSSKVGSRDKVDVQCSRKWCWKTDFDVQPPSTKELIRIGERYFGAMKGNDC